MIDKIPQSTLSPPPPSYILGAQNAAPFLLGLMMAKATLESLQRNTNPKRRTKYVSLKEMPRDPCNQVQTLSWMRLLLGGVSYPQCLSIFSHRIASHTRVHGQQPSSVYSRENMKTLSSYVVDLNLRYRCPLISCHRLRFLL